MTAAPQSCQPEIEERLRVRSKLDFGCPRSCRIASKEAADEIAALRSRVEELTKALEKSLKAGRLLLQNSIGCAVNHYGSDREIHGLPGWLADTEKHLVECASALSLEDRK